VWAGIECTVNRVGDGYFDQMARSGHDRRVDDLDRLALLGVQAIRYPVLWEKHPEPFNWSWARQRLAQLRASAIRPVVGLLHHGSGPPHTSLLDPTFPEQLAAYAGHVAAEFPWVDAYTPVNEPLTTARFSGLYGHWYPHGQGDDTFIRCLFHQIRGVVLAMRAIRRVNPDAKLVQTEDLGQTHAPAHLHDQARFENDRRWLTWDLLCSKVDRHHPLWRYLRWAGATAPELNWFMQNPCPPDVIGVNHYVTSERYLDHRLDHYPPDLHGGNGRDRYADTEAVRVLLGGLAGPHGLLRQVWDRYRRPVAVTETHLGCTSDEQVRWVWEVWQAANLARAAGAEVVAVTAWAAFGTFDWDSLVTRETGNYEPGLFDVTTDPPRPTRVARLVAELAAGVAPTDPALSTPGWWRRPERLLVPPRPRPRSRKINRSASC
jgi:dTDP-4-dehydrorhamnose reductase